MRTKFAWCLLPIFVALLFSGCRDKTVADVNGERISGKEFYKRVEAGIGTEVLTAMVYEKLILQLGRRENVIITDKEIQAEIEKRKERDPYYIQSYTQRGLNLKDIKNSLRVELTHLKLAKKRITISDKDIKSYFQSHRSYWDIPEAVRVRVIVVKTVEEAKKLRKELIEKGTSFDTLARQKSIDTATAPNGGDMGLIYRGTMPSLLEKTIFDTKIRQITQPIKLDNAYAIFKVEEKFPAQKAVFEEIKDLVERHIFTNPYSPYYRYYEQVRQDAAKDAQVKVLWPRYKAIERGFKKVPRPSELWKKEKAR